MTVYWGTLSSITGYTIAIAMSYLLLVFVCHATIVARREVSAPIGGHNESPRMSRAKDRALWFNPDHDGFVGINILETLYFLREDAAAIRRRIAMVRWNSFRPMVMGHRQPGYPFHCYIRPVVRLLSATLVPRMAQHSYRRWQAQRAEARNA